MRDYVRVVFRLCEANDATNNEWAIVIAYVHLAVSLLKKNIRNRKNFTIAL